MVDRLPGPPPPREFPCGLSDSKPGREHERRHSVARPGSQERSPKATHCARPAMRFDLRAGCAGVALHVEIEAQLTSTRRDYGGQVLRSSRARKTEMICRAIQNIKRAICVASKRPRSAPHESNPAHQIT